MQELELSNAGDVLQVEDWGLVACWEWTAAAPSAVPETSS
jgi:hypothetical protein